MNCWWDHDPRLVVVACLPDTPENRTRESLDVVGLGVQSQMKARGFRLSECVGFTSEAGSLRIAYMGEPLGWWN